MSSPSNQLQWIIEEGRYAISGILGSGGMGIVYLARDRILGREVALKVLREPYARSKEFVERFRREANNAAALSHPNIVSVYDRSEPENGSPYIAMEYVSGGTLTELISREAPLPPAEAARMALQVASALNEAHRRGIVHRDIKSGNILLTEDGQVKVADFGISRVAEATAMTRTGQVFGTVSYVSPEQAAGDEVGPESDLYSLGILLYEMLTGEVPFEAESPMGVAVKHVREKPVPVGRKNPKVPEELAVLTMALLSKDPADRPSPASQVAARLERFLEEDVTDVPVNASAVALAEAGGGEATSVMERVAPVGALFRRGRIAALLCAVVVLPLAGLLMLPRQDTAGQDTNKALTPVAQPEAYGARIPDSAAPGVGDAPKLAESAPQERSPSTSRAPREKHSSPSPKPSVTESSSAEASAVAEQSAGGESATSSATAIARPAPADSASPVASQPAVRSTAGSATQPAASAQPVRKPSPQPQPEPAPKPVPAPVLEPAPSPKPVPSEPAVPVTPDVNIPKVQIKPEIPGSVSLPSIPGLPKPPEDTSQP